MRHGVAGVRLCDQSACGLRWPCERHGALHAFPMHGRLIEPTAARLAEAVALTRRRFIDAPACPFCGYTVCDACLAPLGGWVADGPFDEYTNYKHETGAVISFRKGRWYWWSAELAGGCCDRPCKALQTAISYALGQDKP